MYYTYHMSSGLSLNIPVYGTGFVQMICHFCVPTSEINGRMFNSYNVLRNLPR